MATPLRVVSMIGVPVTITVSLPRRDREPRQEVDALADGEHDAVLDQRREALDLDGDLVAAGLELQRDEAALGVGGLALDDVGVHVLDLDRRAGQRPPVASITVPWITPLVIWV